MAENNGQNGTSTPRMKSAGGVQPGTLEQLIGDQKPTTGLGLQGLPENGNGQNANNPANETLVQNAAAASTPAVDTPNPGTTEGAASVSTTPEIPPLTQEQVKTLFGFDGTPEQLKDFLKSKEKSQPVELTEEEKRKKDLELEDKILQQYRIQGGDVQNFVALKQIAQANLKEFSVAQLKKELRAEFPNNSDDQISQIIAERYYQFSDEEIDSLSDDDQKAIAKAKREYGSKKLSNRSSYLQKQAQDILKDLQDAVAEQDLQVAKETEFSSKVDESLSKMPRKLTFRLGELEGVEIPPVVYDVADSDFQNLADTLKDPVKRKQFFFNEDNSLRVENVAQVMLRNAILESAIKKTYLSATDRQVENFRKTFPHGPNDLGVGGSGSAKGRTGKLVAAGQPEVARPKQQ